MYQDSLVDGYVKSSSGLIPWAEKNGKTVQETLSNVKRAQPGPLVSIVMIIYMQLSGSGINI